MTDTYTSRLRLQQPTVGADSGTWGAILNTGLQLIDDAAQGVTTIGLTGLTSYTLSADDGSTDQARMAFIVFTGALTADCTVTIPDSDRIGWVANQTTGNFNVILTNGQSTTLTLAPGQGDATPAQPYYSASASGVYDPMFGKSSLTTVGGMRLPGGLILNWGSGTTAGSGPSFGGASINYKIGFPNAVWCAVASVAGDAGGSTGNFCSIGSPSDASFIQVVTRAANGSLNGPVAFNFFALGN